MINTVAVSGYRVFILLAGLGGLSSSDLLTQLLKASADLYGTG
jgi:hypothetical protein